MLFVLIFGRRYITGFFVRLFRKYKKNGTIRFSETLSLSIERKENMKLELITVNFISDLDLTVYKKLLRFFLFLRGSFFGRKSILFLNI